MCCMALCLPGKAWNRRQTNDAAAKNAVPAAYRRYHGSMSSRPVDFVAIGWPPEKSVAQALQPWPDAQLARVVAQHRSGYELAQHPEHSFRAQAPAHWLRPRTDPELRAVVGDWVALDAQGKQILDVLPERPCSSARRQANITNSN